MEHIAIMNKSWGLIPKILSGQKIIESRWYRAKYAPWGKIRPEEIIYFKNSGEPVTISALVGRVDYFSNLTPDKVKEMLEQYGHDIGIEEERRAEFFEMFKDKRYCMLIFLKNAQQISPFKINKHGFGAMASWLSVESIDRLKR